MKPKTLEEIAELRMIQVHDPFSQFLHAESTMHTFEISLLDCYRMAGHACHSITGAFLVTEAAIAALYPQTHQCVRGDLQVEFGSELSVKATGPRSNVVSFITGSWGDTGFSGFKGSYVRKNLLSYGHKELGENSVKFQRISSGQGVIVEYNNQEFLAKLNAQSEFPEKWREEICAMLKDSSQVLRVSEIIES